MTNAKNNTQSNATTKARKGANAKASTPVRVATIALKTLHDDIMRDNANATITTKKMRVMLRKSYAHIHEHNNSWMFTQNEYDEIRSIYDAKYRAKIERATKVKTSSRVKPRKIDAHVDIVDTSIVATTNADVNAIA